MVCMECALCKQFSNYPCMNDHILFVPVQIMKVHDNVVLTIVEVDRIPGGVTVAFKTIRKTVISDIP